MVWYGMILYDYGRVCNSVVEYNIIQVVQQNRVEWSGAG